MNRKGLALRSVVYAIIAIVFFVVVLFLIMGSGVLSVFYQYFYGGVCTLSSTLRGSLVKTIWELWSIISVAIIVVMIIVGGVEALKAGQTETLFAFSAKEYIKAFGVSALKGLLGGAKTGVIGLIGLIFVVNMIFPKIPLVCPVTQSSIYSDDQIDVKSEMLAQSVDCFNRFGAGRYDPLWGIDPPNPRLCAILTIKSETEIDLTDVINIAKGKFGKNWQLGDDRLYLYCQMPGQFFELSNKVEDWDKCKFKEATLFIMYLDKHEYDWLSYGTAIGKKRIDYFDFIDQKQDSIVWYIEVNK